MKVEDQSSRNNFSFAKKSFSCSFYSVFLQKIQFYTVIVLQKFQISLIEYPCSQFATSSFPLPSALGNIRVMMIVWRLRGNIIGTALCWNYDTMFTVRSTIM